MTALAACRGHRQVPLGDTCLPTEISEVHHSEVGQQAADPFFDLVANSANSLDALCELPD